MQHGFAAQNQTLPPSHPEIAPLPSSSSSSSPSSGFLSASSQQVHPAVLCTVYLDFAATTSSAQLVALPNDQVSAYWTRCVDQAALECWWNANALRVAAFGKYNKQRVLHVRWALFGDAWRDGRLNWHRVYTDLLTRLDEALAFNVPCGEDAEEKQNYAEYAAFLMDSVQLRGWAEASPFKLGKRGTNTFATLQSRLAEAWSTGPLRFASCLFCASSPSFLVNLGAPALGKITNTGVGMVQVISRELGVHAVLWIQALCHDPELMVLNCLMSLHKRLTSVHQSSPHVQFTLQALFSEALGSLMVVRGSTLSYRVACVWLASLRQTDNNQHTYPGEESRQMVLEGLHKAIRACCVEWLQLDCLFKELCGFASSRGNFEHILTDCSSLVLMSMSSCTAPQKVEVVEWFLYASFRGGLLNAVDDRTWIFVASAICESLEYCARSLCFVPEPVVAWVLTLTSMRYRMTTRATKRSILLLRALLSAFNKAFTLILDSTSLSPFPKDVFDSVLQLCTTEKDKIVVELLMWLALALGLVHGQQKELQACFHDIQSRGMLGACCASSVEWIQRVLKDSSDTSTQNDILRTTVEGIQIALSPVHIGQEDVELDTSVNMRSAARLQSPTLSALAQLRAKLLTCSDLDLTLAESSTLSSACTFLTTYCSGRLQYDWNSPDPRHYLSSDSLSMPVAWSTEIGAFLTTCVFVCLRNGRMINGIPQALILFTQATFHAVAYHVHNECPIVLPVQVLRSLVQVDAQGRPVGLFAQLCAPCSMAADSSPSLYAGIYADVCTILMHLYNRQTI
ncbi:hypothetical protein FVE85_7476 [Porphyridium purpureum]|uniref:Uncharacterized protein n=1 Tax=Porphyridium purpureum TaxID=35688 RepID=A0A5J4Z7F8_PORPP|nr:hypothetical protein FVE85_7476 [Porphyridium purpureum]|eukprot:POR2539..scf295_1